MESEEHLKIVLDSILSQSPKDNLSSDSTKRCFQELNALSTKMTYTMSCHPKVVQIIGSDNCINYFMSALNLITDELPIYVLRDFDDHLIYNFITLYMALWNVTDKSCDVCNRFVLADAYKPMWDLLSRKELSSTIFKYKSARLLAHCSLGTLHNLLRYCPRARDDYRSLGGVNILNPYVIDVDVSGEYKNKMLISLKAAALFTLAAIVNKNENVSIITTDQRVLVHILSALRDSLQSPPDYYSAEYGYHAAEVFGCLSCLAEIKSNKSQLFENNALELISTALQISVRVKNGSLEKSSSTAIISRDNYKFSEDTLAKEAIDLLWYLSCLPEVRDQLKETSDLYKLCAQFNNVNWTAECRKSVQALLCILSQERNWLDKHGNLNTSAITVSPKPRGHVMISFNNLAQHLVSKLKEALTLRGWNVWIYTEHCQHGSFLEQMAEAVFDSAAMILCLSSHYNASNHCIKEAISAYDYRLPLLPVVVESDYAPIGFLRFLLTGVQAVQLYNDSQVDDAADKLTDQLRCYGVMREGVNLSRSRPPTSCVPRINPLSFMSIGSTKGHQRSRSDCLAGMLANSQLPQSISTEASAPLTPQARSPNGTHQYTSCQLRSHSSRTSTIPEHLILPPSSASPCSQPHENTYFFNSTPHIDPVSTSCSSAALVASNMPAALEAYLMEQIPSKAVRGWQEDQVRQWLADHSLAHYTHAFAHINGMQLYELAWQRIRGCDSFFRNLSFGMHMPLHEQLLLSSALASLHNYPDPSTTF